MPPGPWESRTMQAPVLSTRPAPQLQHGYQNRLIAESCKRGEVAICLSQREKNRRTFSLRPLYCQVGQYRCNSMKWDVSTLGLL